MKTSAVSFTKTSAVSFAKARNLLLVTLLAGLYGCQPDTPAQQAAAPAAPAVAEAPAPAPVQPAPAAAETPAPAAPAAAPAADDPLTLAKNSGCLVCHAVDKKLVGPAWKDVAAKYRGDGGAEAMLMSKIAKGGSGVWGGVAMPPQPRVSEADRQTLAKFILSLE